MSDFTVVDPKGWEYDLHSVYSAYIGYFQLHNISWYDRSWGPLFSSFEEFLAFSWPVITVTDAWTGKPHIVTRLTSIGAFLKMIKTRFGETLQQAPNILQVTPFETGNRHLRHISDYASYKKHHATLPAVFLGALKARVRTGEPKAIRELWNKRDKTFLAIDFEWSERNEKTCLEWGYTAVRCGHLNDLGHWPPNPDTNYRKGHYIVAEYVDKVFNKHCPTYPWHYAFGESQIVPKAKIPQIIEAVISSFASPDSETTPNTLVLVAHGIGGDLNRLEEMKIKIPHNVLILDTAVYERALHSSGFRGIMLDAKSSKPRMSGSTLSLENLLRSLTTNPLQPDGPQQAEGAEEGAGSPLILPNIAMHNAGNDALMCLFALQAMLEPVGTKVPTLVKQPPARMGWAPGMNNAQGYPMSMGMVMPTGMVGSNSMPVMMVPAMMSPGYMGIAPPTPRTPPAYDLSGEFEQMGLSKTRSKSPAPMAKATNGNGGVNGSVSWRAKQGGMAWKG